MTLTADRSFKETVLDYNIKLDLFPTLIRIQPFRRKRFRPLQWIVLKNNYVYDRYAIGALGALSGQRVHAICRSGFGRSVVSKTSPGSTSRSRSPAGDFKLDGLGRSCGGQSCLWNIALFQPNRNISFTLSSTLLRFLYLVVML